MKEKKCMQDRKEEIINKLMKSDKYFTMDQNTDEFVKDAMDEYAEERCLELLQYIAENKMIAYIDKNGAYFLTRGESLTKEQVFENFL